nr:hypothetical protein CFP56_39035 [Quercus suber]
MDEQTRSSHSGSTCSDLGREAARWSTASSRLGPSVGRWLAGRGHGIIIVRVSWKRRRFASARLLLQRMGCGERFELHPVARLGLFGLLSRSGETTRRRSAITRVEGHVHGEVRMSTRKYRPEPSHLAHSLANKARCYLALRCRGSRDSERSAEVIAVVPVRQSPRLPCGHYSEYLEMMLSRSDMYVIASLHDSILVFQLQSPTTLMIRVQACLRQCVPRTISVAQGGLWQISEAYATSSVEPCFDQLSKFTRHLMALTASDRAKTPSIHEILPVFRQV